jgi:hypothetical protein
VDSPERIYRGSVRAFSLVFIALGLLILITTLAHGGGPLSVGTLLGLVFIAVGVVRLRLSGLFRGRGGRSGGRGRGARGRSLP